MDYKIAIDNSRVIKTEQKLFVKNNIPRSSVLKWLNIKLMLCLDKIYGQVYVLYKYITFICFIWPYRFTLDYKMYNIFPKRMKIETNLYKKILLYKNIRNSRKSKLAVKKERLNNILRWTEQIDFLSWNDET